MYMQRTPTSHHICVLPIEPALDSRPRMRLCSLVEVSDASARLMVAPLVGRGRNFESLKDGLFRLGRKPVQLANFLLLAGLLQFFEVGDLQLLKKDCRLFGAQTRDAKNVQY